MHECWGCGLKKGHKVYGDMVCEYASERSPLFDSETMEPAEWPQPSEEQ